MTFVYGSAEARAVTSDSHDIDWVVRFASGSSTTTTVTTPRRTATSTKKVALSERHSHNLHHHQHYHHDDGQIDGDMDGDIDGVLLEADAASSSRPDVAMNAAAINSAMDTTTIMTDDFQDIDALLQIAVDAAACWYLPPGDATTTATTTPTTPGTTATGGSKKRPVPLSVDLSHLVPTGLLPSDLDAPRAAATGTVRATAPTTTATTPPPTRTSRRKPSHAPSAESAESDESEESAGSLELDHGMTHAPTTVSSGASGASGGGASGDTVAGRQKGVTQPQPQPPPATTTKRLKQQQQQQQQPLQYQPYHARSYTHSPSSSYALRPMSITATTTTATTVDIDEMLALSSNLLQCGSSSPGAAAAAAAAATTTITTMVPSEYRSLLANQPVDIDAILTWNVDTAYRSTFTKPPPPIHRRMSLPVKLTMGPSFSNILVRPTSSPTPTPTSASPQPLQPPPTDIDALLKDQQQPHTVATSTTARKHRSWTDFSKRTAYRN